MNESVQKWLDELTAEPAATLQRLVLGQAAVSAWSRSSLREIFIEVFQTHAEVLDSALAEWLPGRIFQMPPERTPTVVWASHLQDVFRGVAGLPLPKVARALRDRLRDFRSWLRPLRTDESLDPEAAYLAALAWAKTNQHLEGLWQGLVLRRDHEPAYYVDIGLLGLRKTRDEQGELPSKTPFLLLATLIDLADESIGQKNWLLTTRALLGGYHYSLETWAREFEPVLEARPDAKHGPEWLRKVLPQLRARHQNQPHYQQDAYQPIPLAECNAMIREVAQHGLEANGLESFLERHRAYANATRNPHFLVRTFNRLAEAARTHDTDWAIARAEETLSWDDDNARNWTVLARALWTRGRNAEQRGHRSAAEADCREAMDLLWEAQLRFPHDAFVRNELAKILRASDDLDTAEAIYRATIAELKHDLYCLTGLADLLLQKYRSSRDQRQREEAHTLFLEAAERGNSYARRRLEHLDEREEEVESVELPVQSTEDMRPAQRLGRALLFQWRARHAESAGEREHLFAKAEAMLTLPDELTGECRTAFVEARGFLLLARDRATEARAYFEQQLATFSRPPLGLRLGFAEARARLGETLSDTEEAELASFGPEGSILPLVLKVVRLLESTASDDELRDWLIELYPRVRALTGMPASELGEEDQSVEFTASARQRETPDTMMAQLLLASVFRPAAINTSEDLQVEDSILRVRASLKSHRNDIFAVAEKLALAS